MGVMTGLWGIIIIFCVVAYFSNERKKHITPDLSKGIVLSFLFVTCFFMPRFVWKFGFEIIDYIGWYYFWGLLLLGIALFLFSEKARTEIHYLIQQKLHLFKLSTWCIIFLTLSFINSTFLRMLEQTDNESLKGNKYSFIEYSKGMNNYDKTQGLVVAPYREKEITVKYCHPVLIKNKVIYFIVSNKGLFTLEDSPFLTKKSFCNYKDYMQYANSLIGKTFIIKPPYFSLFKDSIIQSNFPSTRFEIYGCQNINPFAFFEKSKKVSSLGTKP